MAQIGGISGSIGPSKSEVVGVGIGIAAVGAVVGVGIYYAVHHGHNLTGCALSGPGGPQLQSQGDQQPYLLIGNVAAIKSGERVRVSGKKSKQPSGAPRQFAVERLIRDYGACPVSP
jgi:hypothetical protein